LRIGTHADTRDRDFDLQFDDFRCLNGYTEGDLGDAPQKDVQRVTEIYESPNFFPKGGAVTSNAIAQGRLGDCYFLAALATVSSFPSLIEKICVAVSTFSRFGP
jgi:Calpain family cysteine protease